MGAAEAAASALPGAHQQMQSATHISLDYTRIPCDNPTQCTATTQHAPIAERQWEGATVLSSRSRTTSTKHDWPGCQRMAGRTPSGASARLRGSRPGPGMTEPASSASRAIPEKPITQTVSVNKAAAGRKAVAKKTTVSRKRAAPAKKAVTTRKAA